jgi:hypothetical protein
MPKAYIHIYNQCSTNLKNDLGTSSVYLAVDAAKDPIGLLKLIQGLCCSYDSKTQSVMATIASHKLLFTYYRKDGVDNTTYHREIMVHVETIEFYGGVGAVGNVPAFITQMLKTMHTEGLCSDPDNPTEVELAVARATVCEEFLAGLMLSGANRDRYNALQTKLADQYTFGNDLYPKTVDQCLTMLNRCKDPSSRTPRNVQQQQQSRAGTGTPKQEDEALLFAQDSNCSQAKTPSTPPASKPLAKGSTSSSSSSQSVHNKSKITKVFCKNCGKIGHISLVCPDNKPPPDQIHTITTGQDDASVFSADERVDILAQVDETLLTQKTSLSPPCCPIDSDLLPLDSQSTVHLFSRPEHVNNIRPAANPIRVHCNKGILETTTEANFGHTPVYFDLRGIANVLSLYCLGQQFQVTYDSAD